MLISSNCLLTDAEARFRRCSTLSLRLCCLAGPCAGGARAPAGDDAHAGTLDMSQAAWLDPGAGSDDLDTDRQAIRRAAERGRPENQGA